MVKKKQPDFQPTKLRVGKRLPKGRNITNTSFKSKKIVIKEQKFKTSTEEKSLPDLLSQAKNTNATIKVDALKKIGKYVDDHIFTLASYFSDILKVVGRLLIQDHAKVRQEARELLANCVEQLLGPQMNCFMVLLTSHLDCMMTHIDISVKSESLYLLSALLRAHPNLICYFTKTLNNLLNMISTMKHIKSGKSTTQKKRKLDDNINNIVTSVEWRDQVLKLILEFLENLVSIVSKDKNVSEEEQKVYWDGKRPLYVPLYAGSGLTPAKLEVYLPRQRKSEDAIAKELHVYVFELVSVLSDVVTEEVSSLIFSPACQVLGVEHVLRLNTVTQILCCLADWYKLGSKVEFEEDTNFLPLMNSIICEKLMKGFYYTVHDTARTTVKKVREEACNHLNLGISYLYCTFILGTKYAKESRETLVIHSVVQVLKMEANIDEKSLLLVLKIVGKIIDHNSSFKVTNSISPILKTLSHVYAALKKKSDKKIAIKELQSFFIEITTNYDYKFLLEYDGIESCLKQIFDELNQMKKAKKSNKRILKCINQMCTREYDKFINILNDTPPSEILDLLKFEDVDFQFTVMNLITHMTGLDPEFMQDIADLILDDDILAPKTVVRFIRLLHNRFSDSRVPVEEYFEFVKFLFNVGCDVVSIEKCAEENYKMHTLGNYKEQYRQKRDNQDVIIALSYDYGLICRYVILPPYPNSERHTEIFEVCLECLLLYPHQELIVQLANNFFRELADSKIYLPLHCAVALRKISTHFLKRPLKDGQEFHTGIFSIEIMVSSLFYISILTNEFPDEERLKSLGIKELKNSMALDRRNAIKVLECMLPKMYPDDNNEGGMTPTIALHILRTFKYFLSKRYMNIEDITNIGLLLQTLTPYCAEHTQENAILCELLNLAMP